MAKLADPVMIKRKSSRRLYETRTGDCVTFGDLAAMVKKGEAFVVYDARTNEDTTRTALGQATSASAHSAPNATPLAG